MQAIPTTGVAQGIKYLESINSPLLLKTEKGKLPVVICSFGDGSVTEGEVSEALQFAVLKQLPVIYLVQDNDWGISAKAEETRAMNAYEYADGFKGLSKIQIDGTDFTHCHKIIGNVINEVRKSRKPWLVHANVPLLNHHTSGVRKDFYRSEEDLAKDAIDDPFPKLKNLLLENEISEEELGKIETDMAELISADFMKALNSPEPDIKKASAHIFIPTNITDEKGER